MNQIIESLYHRKSTRVFTDKLVTESIKTQIIEAAMQAPTAGNMHLYSIIDIQDPEIKMLLSESCDHQPFIAQAPLVFVFCADYYRAWSGMHDYITDNVRQPEVGDLLLAMSDALICAQNMVVAAESLGLGSCYIGDIIENFEYHRELLKLPNAVWPICMLVIGYPTPQQIDRPKPIRFPKEFVLHINQYEMLNSSNHQDFIRNQFNQQTKKITEIEYYSDLYHRKYTANFTSEMNRSAKAMIDSLNPTNF